MTDRDLGLQAERTALAWRRTALALAALCLVVLREAVSAGPVATAAAVLGVAATWAAWLAWSAQRIRHLHHHPDPRTQEKP